VLENDEIEPRTFATSVVDSDPHHFGNLDPHRIKIRIRIRIKVIRWIRNQISDPHQFADEKPNIWNTSLFKHFFKGLSLTGKILLRSENVRRLFSK
jgi:hypothetical protein